LVSRIIMTAILLVTATTTTSHTMNSHTPPPPPTQDELPLSIDPYKDKSTHHEITLSMKSPGLVKKKRDIECGMNGGLTTTSLQLLRNTLTSPITNTSININSIDHSTTKSYHKLKRLDTEPIPSTNERHEAYSNDGNSVTENISITSSSQQCEDRLTECKHQKDVSSTRRRQIFSTFWGTANESSSLHGRREQRTRSNSCCSIDVVSTKTLPTHTIPCPPQPLQSRSKPEGYSYGRMVDSSSSYYPPIPKHLSLSTLPSPMQRLRKSSGGVYPLVKPKSILRRPQRITAITPAEDEMNFTQTVRSGFNKRDDFKSTSDDTSTETNFDRSSSISSHSFNSIQNGTLTTTIRKPVVHFDPRITITELAERDHERMWYSNDDLNRFRYETVLTARAFFDEHPDQIVVYNKPSYDPVTKTMRKRALFSMPALADITITEHDDNNSCSDKNKRKTISQSKIVDDVLKHQQHLLSLLAFEDNCADTKTTSQKNEMDTIRRILIVDHNPLLLDLFVRSVRTMFVLQLDRNNKKNSPIDIQRASTAEAAMSIIQKRTLQQKEHSTTEPPFDLIIAEQASQLPNQVLSETIGSGPPAATAALPENSLFGSEFLFQNLEKDYRDQILLVSVVSSTNQVKQSRNNSSTTIADMIWSKPPPRMDTHLRTQLIRALQNKRRRYQQLKVLEVKDE
jgi:hypothetical protein